jgi:hypothetical protein
MTRKVGYRQINYVLRSEWRQTKRCVRKQDMSASQTTLSFFSKSPANRSAHIYNRVADVHFLFCAILNPAHFAAQLFRQRTSPPKSGRYAPETPVTCCQPLIQAFICPPQNRACGGRATVQGRFANLLIIAYRRRYSRKITRGRVRDGSSYLEPHVFRRSRETFIWRGAVCCKHRNLSSSIC